ncbi:hypothetical protein [Actinacidiphila yeochonensis]|uniref:hypothetical protein n=1 Tax=Actinacidiphila yeochonensis TaxID=89050 RepID=UPI000AE2D6EF|nr:hypothetical protein [Actinacidiphila yeochonensis]
MADTPDITANNWGEGTASDGTWSRMLASFHSNPSEIQTAEGIGSDSSPSWIASHTVIPQAPADYEGFDVFDIWFSYPYTLTTVVTGYETVMQISGDYQYVVGCNLTHDVDTNDAGTPLYKFVHQPDDILVPLANQAQVAGENVTSLLSFQDAAAMVGDFKALLTSIADTLDGWTDNIDFDDSALQGDSAKAFKDALLGMKLDVTTLQAAMNADAVVQSLNQSHDDLQATLRNLESASQTWRGARWAWPANATHDALQWALQSGSISFPGTQNVPPTVNVPGWGDPTTEDFWMRVEARAKAMWMNNVYVFLDQPAANEANLLGGQYGSAVETFTTNTPQPGDGGVNPYAAALQALATPTPAITDTPPAGTEDTLPAGTTDTTPGSTTDTPLGSDDMPAADTLSTTTTGSQSGELTDGEPTGDTTGDPTGTTGDDFSLPPTTSTTTGTAGGLYGGTDTTGTGSDEVLDKDGNVVLDAAGNPVVVPTGSTINADGTVTGPDGKLLTGSDGKNLTVPKGSRLTPAQTVTDADGNPVTVDGQELTVPEGSTINADGTITGPDGQLLTGSDGQALTVPKGSKLTALDPLAESDYSGLTGTTGTTGSTYTSSAGDYIPSSIRRTATTSAADDEYLAPEEGGVVSENIGSTGKLTSGMGKNVQEEGALGEETSPSSGLAAETAAEEAAAMSRTATTSGSTPMMPPMGGGGAGGAGGDQSRGRKTWLDEEEEVWGTGEEAVPGVIGG